MFRGVPSGPTFLMLAALVPVVRCTFAEGAPVATRARPPPPKAGGEPARAVSGTEALAVTAKCGTDRDPESPLADARPVPLSGLHAAEASTLSFPPLGRRLPLFEKAARCSKSAAEANVVREVRGEWRPVELELWNRSAADEDMEPQLATLWRRLPRGAIIAAVEKEAG
mmetsp:Transcript_67744/g.147576  ORF Transcript_67744/g.147576 Transcript_67744/m.147576 type:complete len:169 (+) Transcript_67744:895-1401(+)